MNSDEIAEKILDELTIAGILDEDDRANAYFLIEGVVIEANGQAAKETQWCDEYDKQLESSITDNEYPSGDPFDEGWN